MFEELCSAQVFGSGLQQLELPAAAMPAKRKAAVKAEPTSQKVPRTPSIKKSLSSVSESTEVPSTAALSLPHVQMFSDW